MGLHSANWALLQDSIGNAPARAVLLYLALRADDETGICYPGQDTIAKKTSLSVRAVRNAINWLFEAGYMSRDLRIKNGRRITSLYRLNHGNLVSPAPDAAGGDISVFDSTKYDLKNGKITPPAPDAAGGDFPPAPDAADSNFPPAPDAADSNFPPAPDAADSNFPPAPNVISTGTKRHFPPAPDAGNSSGRDSTEDLKKKPLSGKPDDAAEIFDYWRTVHSKPQSTFTEKRKKLVIARLKKYRPDQIRQAIDGCKLSPHHQGFNDRGTMYVDLTLICRDDTYLEQFIDLYDQFKDDDKPNTNTAANRGNAPRDGKFAHVGTVDYSDFEHISFEVPH